MLRHRLQFLQDTVDDAPDTGAAAGDQRAQGIAGARHRRGPPDACRDLQLRPPADPAQAGQLAVDEHHPLRPGGPHREADDPGRQAPGLEDHGKEPPGSHPQGGDGRVHRPSHEAGRGKKGDLL